MAKNQYVRNINTIGTIMRIFLIVARILAVLALVITIGLTVFAVWVPVDDVKITSTIHVDIEGLDDDMKVESDSSSKWDLGDFAVKWYLKEKDVPGKYNGAVLDGEVSEITGSQIKGFAIKKLIIADLYMIAVFIALIFGGKLAKALQKCDTPFSDEIVKKLVSFGKSLIPLGICSLLIGASGIDMAAVILVLFLFISLFKYGAHLQKSVDGMA